jgi:ADP-heptose:LPS heptosyltransferase
LIELNPRDSRAFHRLISVYIRMQRYHDAIACCQLALDIDGRSLTAHYNLGVANLSLNRDNEALNNFVKTVEIDPKNQWAQINIAHILLKQGLFEQGWRQYEWRKAFYERKTNDLAAVYPEWTGQALAGKNLLIWADQGLGDIVMYAGFISRLTALGCRLSILAEPRLQCLFERSFELLHFYPEVITPQQQASHKIDYQIPFSGLAARFIGTFADFSDPTTYLIADKDRSEQIRAELIEQYGRKKIIGFSWRGGLAETRKYARHIPIEQWRALLSRNDFLFINLQYNSTQHERSLLQSYGGVNIKLDQKQDIDGVAATLKAVDLFISMDNSTAHLAGALGVPVWNLLPFSSEWRWFLDNEKTYWYQNMRLLRQQVVDSWKQSLAAIEQTLTEDTD